jgi:hypothetical protein
LHHQTRSNLRANHEEWKRLREDWDDSEVKVFPTPVHNAWQLFIVGAEIQHGEIERLKIQDGLPVLAEVTTKKVKFSP